MKSDRSVHIELSLKTKIAAATVFAIDLAIVIYIFLLQTDLTSLDRQLRLQQSLIRQRDYIYFLAGLANTYIAEGSFRNKRDLDFMLSHTNQEIEELEKLLPASQAHKQYLQTIYKTFADYANKAVACQEESQSSLQNQAKQQDFRQITQKFLQLLISTDDTAGIPLMMSTAKVKAYARLAAGINTIFLYFIVLNIALMLSLFGYIILGNKSVFAYLTSTAPISQKVNFLILPPLVFQLCFIVMLHLMFELSLVSITDIGKARLIDIRLERLANNISAIMQPHTPASFSAGQRDKLQAEMNDLKMLSTNDAQQIHAFSIIEKLVAEHQGYAQEARSDTTTTRRKELMADIGNQAVARLIYLARPNRAGDILYKEKELVLGKTARSARLAQNFLMAGTILTITLSLLLLCYMNFSLSARFKIIVDNIRRRSKDEPLLPPLRGSDELAQVDHFFHTTITKIEESQSKEKAIIENASDIICTLDNKLRFLSANHALEPLLGYTNSEIIGTTMLDLVAANEQTNTKQACQTLFMRQEPLQLENSIRKKSGDYIDVLWSMQQSENLIFCVVRDISERKQMERFKQQFLSMISHDLRTPITTLLVSIEMMQTGALGEFTEEGLLRLHDSHQRIKNVLTLINNLLDLEKIEAGQMQFHITDVDLTLILDAIIVQAQSTANQKHVLISGELGEIRIFADRERITRALSAILNVACTRAPQSSQIHVATDCSNNTVSIQIRERGNKIPATKLADFFEHLTIAQEIFDKQDNQDILSLPLSAAIIKSHNGTISISSTDEKTIWTITLPAPNSTKNVFQLSN